ncbi:MAG: hypothetical protein ABFS18_01850 [Thermodesulfobacteriota bacterium]
MKKRGLAGGEHLLVPPGRVAGVYDLYLVWHGVYYFVSLLVAACMAVIAFYCRPVI